MIKLYGTADIAPTAKQRDWPLEDVNQQRRFRHVSQRVIGWELWRIRIVTSWSKQGVLVDIFLGDLSRLRKNIWYQNAKKTRYQVCQFKMDGLHILGRILLS